MMVEARAPTAKETIPHETTFRVGSLAYRLTQTNLGNRARLGRMKRIGKNLRELCQCGERKLLVSLEWPRDPEAGLVARIKYRSVMLSTGPTQEAGNGGRTDRGWFTE